MKKTERIDTVQTVIENLYLEDTVELWNKYQKGNDYIYTMDQFNEEAAAFDTPLELAQHLYEFNVNDIFFISTTQYDEHVFSSFDEIENIPFYSSYQLATWIVEANKPTGIEDIDAVLDNTYDRKQKEEMRAVNEELEKAIEKAIEKAYDIEFKNKEKYFELKELLREIAG